MDKSPNIYRLNRAIAQTGFTSRRDADRFVLSGRVKVNGKVVTDFNYAINLDKDIISIDDKRLGPKELTYIVMYKPIGIITTVRDERGRNGVIDLLPEELRHLRPVGRLDADSEGLLLITNDGQLAQKLTHPSHQTYKTYQVTVKGNLTQASANELRSGIRLGEGITKPAEVRLIRSNANNSVFEIAIKEGRNRQIRRMCAKLGFSVVRLVRVAIGRLQLRQMKASDWRFLTPQELRDLKSG